MNTRNDTGFRTFLVGTGGVTRHTRVKIDTGTIVTAGAGEDSIGTAMDTVAAGGYCAVKLWCAPGTHCLTSAGAITAGAAVYGAASGKIDDTVAGNKIGVALEAATGADQDIEVLPADVGTLFAAAAHVADATQTQDTLTDSSTGSASTTLAACTNTTNLTDNGGGTADGTVAAQAAPVTITDSSGKHATHDDTIAAIVNTTNLVDNGGGTADGTVASQAAPVTLTDSSGKHTTHDDEIAAATPAAAITDNSGGSDPGDNTIAAISTGGAAADQAPTAAAIAQLAAKLNTTSTAIGVLLQNDSDLAQKLIEFATLATTAQNNLKEVTTELAAQRTANDVLSQNQSDLAQKLIEFATLAGTAQNNLKEVTTELATQRSLNAALTNAVASMAAQLAKVKTDVGGLVTKFNTTLANLEANGIHLPT